MALTPAAPPHDREAEEVTLGAVLRDRGAGDIVFDRLDEADFYDPGLRKVYGAMRRLYDANRPIDTVTVVDALRRAGAGGALPRLVGELWDRVPSAANVDYYCYQVAEASTRRRLLAAADRVAELARDLGADLDVAIDSAESIVGAVAHGPGAGTSGLEGLGQLLSAVLEHVEAAEKAPPAAIPTGLADLDRRLGGGFQPGSLNVIAGRPGMGKSALAVNIAAHVASLNRGAVAFFSLEMAGAEVAHRLLAAEARVDSMILRGLGGDVDAGQWRRLAAAAGRIDQWPFYADEGSRTVTDVRARCRRLRRRAAGGLALVVVDYLQLMRGGGRDTRQEEIADISLGLKALARELRTPVVAVSQLNRAVEGRGDKRPLVSDLRESGAIEQDADTVLLIYRDSYYFPHGHHRGEAEINVAKQRAGPTGTVKVTFDAPTTRFADLVEPPPPARSRPLPGTR